MTNFIKKEKTKIIALLLIIAIGITGICVAVYQNIQKIEGTHIKVGNYEVSTLEYEFYKQSYENSFLTNYADYLTELGIDKSKDFEEQQCVTSDMTWDEYFEGRTLEFIQETYILYDEALKNKFKIDTEELYSSFIDSCTKSANDSNMSINDYLSSYYANGANTGNFKNVYEKYITAMKYREQKKIDLAPSEEELNNFYDDNKDALDTVTYRDFIIKANCEEDADTKEIEKAMNNAKEKAQAMFERIYDQKTYIELCAEYNESTSTDDTVTDFDKYTKNEKVVYSAVPTTLKDWLYDKDREENATAIIEDSSENEYHIVYFISRQKNDTKTTNFRHILIAPTIEANETEASTEAWETAKKEADSIWQEWKSSDKTVDIFTDLVKKYSDDTETADNGGLYENIIEGNLPEDLNNWLFDDKRQEGDVELIKADTGYHIMYYVKKGNESWEVEASKELTETAYDEFIAKNREKFKIVDVKGEVKYLKLSEDKRNSASNDTAIAE